MKVDFEQIISEFERLKAELKQAISKLGILMGEFEHMIPKLWLLNVKKRLSRSPKALLKKV